MILETGLRTVTRFEENTVYIIAKVKKCLSNQMDVIIIWAINTFGYSVTSVVPLLLTPDC